MDTTHSLKHSLKQFEDVVWEHYQNHGRHDLPWRSTEANGAFDPYKIMVSEIMLQQTQVARVIVKYQEFLQRFPTASSLAQASLADVLTSWSGLGYNRRAKFLWHAAQLLENYGRFPETIDQLVLLPGVGVNTAGAIAAYAFDRPVVYIETNIRTVLIYHFFADRTDVADKDLQALLHEVMHDIERDNNPNHTARAWYWALMDYGAFLKQTVGNVSRQSKLYVRQSTFQGSKRQIRGQVLKLLSVKSCTKNDLTRCIKDERLRAVLDDLVREEFISRQQDRYHLGTA